MGVAQWMAAAEMAKAQFGVVSLAQFSGELGITRSSLVSALHRGRVERLFHSAYRFPGGDGDWRQRAFAATLVTGPGSAVSHHTAGALYKLAGLEQCTRELHVSVAGRRSRSLPSPFIVHRPQQPFLVCTHLRMPTTSITRTIIDLAGVLEEEALEIALDDAQHRFRDLGPQLEKILGRLKRQYPGLATLRELVRVRQGRCTESALEVRAWRALRKASLDPPRLQFEVHDAGHSVMRVDFAWPQHRVAIHTDSFLWHARRNAFDTDARQRAQLASLGWANVPVTRRSLEDGAWLEGLRRLLQQRRPQLDFAL